VAQFKDKPFEGHYGANHSLMPLWLYPNMVKKQSAVKAVSKTYMIFDAGDDSSDTDSFLAPYGSQHYIPGLDKLVPETSTPSYPLDPALVKDFHNGRHFSGINVCYADGHVKWLRTDKAYADVKTGGPNFGGPMNPDND
jgi:prepilin-type processing-associated H-X9-DG protein